MRIGQSFAALLVLVLAPPDVTYAQVCGNGVREGSEQCDDGNTVNLDGCSATCTFEQVQRVNQLNMQFATDTVCSMNALGGAFGSVAQGQLNSAINGSVTDGSTSALIYFVNLSDLSGQSAATVNMGFLKGAPASTTGGYNGNSDLDWWYVPDDLEIDSSRLPTDRLSGNISAGVLTGGPGVFELITNLGGTPTTLHISSLMINAAIGASSTPMAYAGSTTRGHVTAENLDPALTSFATSGNPSSPSGHLCGNISAASLAATAVPPAFATGGVAHCDQGYSVANSALDMLVGGCMFSGFLTVVLPTQPDRSDSAAPAAGAGAPYHLSASAANKIVDTCRDKTNAVVPLTTCLNAAAYSSFFKFSADRVMFKDDMIFKDGFE